MSRNTFVFTGKLEKFKTNGDSISMLVNSSRLLINKETGDVVVSPLWIQISYTGKIAQSLLPKLVEGQKLAFESVMVGNNKGSPEISKTEAGEYFAKYTAVANRVRIVSPPTKNGTEDLQFLSILGYLGQDPEMRYTPDGKMVANFSVATNRVIGSGPEKVTETIWWRCSAWEKTADNITKYFNKGKQIFLTVTLSPDDNGNPRIFTRKDGTVGASFDVMVNSFDFVGKSENGGGYTGASVSQPEDEEIPF